MPTEEERIGLSTRWMALQDEGRQKAELDRSILAGKIDTLGERVDSLAASSVRTETWLQANHDTLTSVADGIRSLEKLGTIAEKVSKVVKPIFWLVTIGGACWAWGKQLLSAAMAAASHIPLK